MPLIGREPKPMTADYDKAVREHMVFVVEAPGRLDAALELIPATDHLLIENVAVAPTAQGRGLGTQLMAVAERVARDLGVSEIRLYTNARFAENIALYEKLGYVLYDRVVISGAGEAVWMRKHLDAPQAAPHLLPEGLRVPLWRDGPAPLGRVAYYRGVWAVLGMIVAIGVASFGVMAGSPITVGHIAIPAAISVIGLAFSLWQFWLIVVAARRSVRNGGAPRPAGLAIAGAVLGVLVLAGSLHSKAVPQFMELWAIYRGDQAMDDLYIIVAKGSDTMTLDGSLGINAASNVRRMLDQNPSVRTIVMEGPGGRIGPAYEIFQLIRSRRLNTRVEQTCDSACTIMFLGGVQRSLGPYGRLGFHQAGFPGMSPADLIDANRQMERFLTFQARVSSDFARRVIQTPNDTIWSPTPEELLAAGVIHRSDARRK
ncbi:MAG: GNAT family N-acetyltransferase [Alphaproteobacteria bacterium]|nr:GNAT family N-acetyltransferase [Alphaproteobacteria bacterium]